MAVRVHTCSVAAAVVRCAVYCCCPLCMVCRRGSKVVRHDSRQIVCTVHTRTGTLQIERRRMKAVHASVSRTTSTSYSNPTRTTTRGLERWCERESVRCTVRQYQTSGIVKNTNTIHYISPIKTVLAACGHCRNPSVVTAVFEWIARKRRRMDLLLSVDNE